MNSKETTVVEIDSQAYASNISFLKGLYPPSVKLSAVLKGDGYGHGIANLVSVALRSGADTISIVDNWEAKQVRKFEPNVKLYRLRPALVEEVKELLHLDVVESVGSLEQASLLDALARSQGVRLSVTVVLDLGINRMSFHRNQRAEVEQLIRLPNLRVDGFLGHFPSSPLEPEVVVEEFVSEAISYGTPSPLLHFSNSDSALRHVDLLRRLSEEHHRIMVRTGLVTYGLLPSGLETATLRRTLRPVLRFRTRVVLLRLVPGGTAVGYDSLYRTPQSSSRWLATLPVGYADGYPRTTNGPHVLVRGRRCPIVGKVSMNMIIIDASLPGNPSTTDLSLGDEAVLVGPQGDDCIFLEELAEKASTINYVIACNIGKSSMAVRRVLNSDGNSSSEGDEGVRQSALERRDP